MNHSEVTIPRLATNPLSLPIGQNSHLWNDACKISLCDVTNGDIPKNSTTVMLGLYGMMLCIQFRCMAHTLRAQLTGPGSPVWNEEAVEVFLMPPNSTDTYFEIDLNPLNTITQLSVKNNGASGEQRVYVGDSSWRCYGLETRVEVNGQINRPGKCNDWSAELFIPLTSLTKEIHEVSGLPWKANFFRIDAGDVQYAYQAWQPTGAIDFHLLAAFGKLFLNSL